MRNFANQALERQLANEQLRGLLVLADLAQGDGPRAEAMRLLDAASCAAKSGMTFARGLGGKLFARRLAASALAGSLLGAGHDWNSWAEPWNSLELLFGTLWDCCVGTLWNWSFGGALAELWRSFGGGSFDVVRPSLFVFLLARAYVARGGGRAYAARWPAQGEGRVNAARWPAQGEGKG